MKALALLLLPAFLAAAAPSRSKFPATAPMQGPGELVAGNSTAGDADGTFMQARFDHPWGLAWIEPGKSLLLSDSGNNSLRRVELGADGGIVSTVSGAEKGFQDGAFAQARFDQPQELLPFGPHGLLLLDQARRAFRRVDVDAGTVSTVAWADSMALVASGDPLVERLAWIEQDARTVKMLADGVTRTVGVFDPPGQPKTLALVGGRLLGLFEKGGVDFAASLDPIHDSAWVGVTPVAESDLAWAPVDATHILALGRLRGGFYRISALGNFEPLPWFDYQGPNAQRDKGARQGQATLGLVGARGLLVDWARNDYLVADSSSHRLLRYHDRDWGNESVTGANSRGHDEYEYRGTPGPGVRRINVLGNSVSHWVLPEQLRALSFTKQMELQANAVSAVQGHPGRYELLFSGFNASAVESPSLYALRHVLDLKAEGIQALWLDYTSMDAFNDVWAYIRKGVGPDGLPPASPDPEAELASDKERQAWLPKGVALAYARLKTLNQTGPGKGIFDIQKDGRLDLHDQAFPVELMDDPEFSAAVEAAIVKHLKLLKKAVAPMPVLVCLFPNKQDIAISEMGATGIAGPESLGHGAYLATIQRAAETAGVEWVDLIDDVRALEPSFAPLFMPGNPHMSARGAHVCGLAAAVRLLQWDGVIPVPAAAKTKP